MILCAGQVQSHSCLYGSLQINKTSMKTKEEIDELYHKCWDDFSNKYDDNLHYYSFVEGYTKCQEDMVDKKYTEDDIYKAIDFGRCHSSMTDRDFINSLNKQD